MAHKKIVRLHSEYKPVLSILNIVVDFSDGFRVKQDCQAEDESFFIEVLQDCIYIRHNKTICAFHLQNLELLPPSCRGLRLCSPNELHMSVQAKFDHDKMAANSMHCENDIITQIEDDTGTFNQDVMVNKIRQCQNRCYCAGCGRPIFQSKGSFRRILPLPTENWSDFADIWFCHNHQEGVTPHQEPLSTTSSETPELHKKPHHHHEQQHQSRRLGPRPGDCLVSNLYMLVDSSRVCSTTVGVTPLTQRLICLRCGNFIGFVKKQGEENKLEKGAEGEIQKFEVFKIYLHAVKFISPKTTLSFDPQDAAYPFDKVPQNPCDSVSESLVEDFLCQLLRDQSRLFTSFRFIVQSSHEEHADSGPVVLLLWLLDQNLRIFSGSCCLPEGQSQACKIDVEVKHVLKLLYKGTFLSQGLAASRGDELMEGSVYKAWERDNTVHSLDLPYPLCKQLLSLLITSTKQLPISHRSLNSFHVGYLKYRPVVPVTG